MPLDKRLKKALLNNRNQMKSTRVNTAYQYAQEHKIKVTKKEIKDYIKGIDSKSLTKISPTKTSKQFVFNFIGGWFADIGFNRNAKMGQEVDGNDWLKQFVLFVNGNSGWARVYEAPHKSRGDVSRIIHNFISEMKRKDYPVKQIITDNDQAFDLPDLPIHRIQSEVADNDQLEHKNHRLFSRIDTFMSHLRRYAWHEYNTGGDPWKKPKICNQSATKELYIPLDTINRFVWEWNQRVIPVIRCTRNQMMDDENLEKAYICAALYGNQLKESAREQFQIDSTVKLRAPRGKVFGNKQEIATGQRAGVYTIKRNAAGHYVGEDSQGRQVHFNADQIEGLYDEGALDDDIQEVLDVEDEINNPQQWSHQVSRFQELKPVESQNLPKRKSDTSRRVDEDIDYEGAAKELAIRKQLDELDMGLFPELGPEKLYKSAKAILTKLKQIDQAKYNKLIWEGKDPSRKMSKVNKKRLRAGIKESYYEERNPYLHQDIPWEAADRIGRMIKLSRQRAARKNYVE